MGLDIIVAVETIAKCCKGLTIQIQQYLFAIVFLVVLSCYEKKSYSNKQQQQN